MTSKRRTMGIPGMDEILHGGLSGQGSYLLVGSAGTGEPLDCPPQLDGLRVLVVDDEFDARHMLDAKRGGHIPAAALTAYAGAEVASALCLRDSMFISPSR